MNGVFFGYLKPLFIPANFLAEENARRQASNKIENGLLNAYLAPIYQER
ncbi:hypothetical protein AG0111_0g11732 [Alternaria gaisen]|uniref:Uncharacterized protein n=2 Tax=Alternaria gaisen TaxID=167740 RepID=A0ACB6F6X4_9PLEO|nr:hypothetical protein AG0111_0g11767 [Alternaria gaisen]KAB2100143.1 hypothetical protein AG0111_0g11732 [Alternaria gaisen]